MSNCRSFKLQSAGAVAIVESVKKLTSELTVAISRDDYTNKFCFHGLITDRAKKVDYLREKYIKAAEELENLTGLLETAKMRLNDIDFRYCNLVQENRALESRMESIKCGDYLCNNERKGFNNSRLKLRLYKMLTGIYYDLKNSIELSGFIAVRGDGKKASNLIPFTFDKKEDMTLYLWDKIGEAIQDDKENLYTSPGKHLEQIM